MQSEESKVSPRAVTQDVKRPDFVLVIKEENLSRIDIYLNNIRVLGLESENEAGKTINLIFIKVYASEEALTHFSELHDIGSGNSLATSSFYTEPIFATPFTNPIVENGPLLEGELTEAEKIMVVNKILETAKYGQKDEEFGLSNLLRLKIIETAYPLHDGRITVNGTNTRSLLYNYWSNSSVAHMQQPLDLIFRYFGNEVAFYFAWLEYFNVMLVIPAILGAITFLANLCLLIFGEPVEVKEMCENKMAMCPYCEGTPGCEYKTISNFCSLAHWTYAFDNNLTVIFAVFITIWTTLFVAIWRRKENKLKLRWNCVSDVRETEIRQAYIDGATSQQPNIVTGEMEPYTPKLRTLFQYSVTFTACAILFSVILSVVLLNMVLNIAFLRSLNTSNNRNLKANAKLLSMILGASIQVFCIKMFEKFYGPAAISLTKFENPRTQHDFDNSVLYKKYLLAFMNNYVPMSYLAFFKGKFATLPHKMTFFRKDACQPCNCVVALCLQLLFVMTVKTFLGNIYSLVVPQIKWLLKFFGTFCCQKSQHKLLVHQRNISQWEEEYYLEPLQRYSVTKEFTEMVIRYGYVSFFSEIFPLASLCALVNNLIELRSDAYKFVKLYRRSVPIVESGIGAWNGILRSLTYLSTAINAFVIAFTTDWVPKQAYRLNKGHGDLKGFFNSTLCKYATVDHKGYELIEKRREFCYFRGFHHPPESPSKYIITQDYWVDLTFRFVAIFIFEHIILLGNSIIAYCIPYEPESVKVQLDLNRQRKKETLLLECEQKLEQVGAKLDLKKSLQGLQQ